MRNSLINGCEGEQLGSNHDKFLNFLDHQPNDMMYGGFSNGNNNFGCGPFPMELAIGNIETLSTYPK